jgi:hypothetical protein
MVKKAVTKLLENNHKFRAAQEVKDQHLKVKTNKQEVNGETDY